MEWFFSQFFATPVHRDVTEEVKVWLALIAAVLAISFWAWHRWMAPRADAKATWTKRTLQLLLGVLCVTSFCNYSRYDDDYVWVERVDAYDLVHYYLNAKYFDELGYFELYPAVLLAHHEEGEHAKRPLPSQVQFQNEEDYYFVSTREFLSDAEEHQRIRDLFGDQTRWLQFRHDFIYLQRDVKGFSRETWVQMLNDHGFNGAPTWVTIAQPLANSVPIESVKVLGYLDALWLLLALGLVWWAFDGTAAAFTFVFLMTTYSMRWPTLTWAFGRYDYVALLIIAVCLLKKAKHHWAGAATALATSFRVFPAVWLWGPAFRGAWDLIRHRKLNKKLVTLGAAFVITHLLLWGVVSARLGTDPIERHFDNLFAHTTEDNLSSMREGFAIATAYTPSEAVSGLNYILTGEPPNHNNRMNQERRERIKDQKKVRQILAILLVLALGFGLRRAKDHESFAMGFIPFFLMATASYYYYVVRSTLVCTHAGDLTKGRNAFALAFLFFIEAAINWVQQNHPDWRVIHIGWLGWLLVIYSVAMVVVFNVEAYKAGKLTAGAPSSPSQTPAS
ncbi:MAG: DUF2029 domain-containing protein [Proteobacteria bacterium]|nr:DUF2029 domain-containing protein [Pseudomonadota bacterium]MCP4915316.1 DUF2029 domain-containing protein [Pseudomonadota bacterium]